MANAYLIGTDALAARRGQAVDVDEQLAQRIAAEVERAEVPERVLQSPLDGIEDERWTDFVRAMKVAEPGAVSAWGDIGMFGFKPRRLADFGLMENLKKAKSPAGPVIWVGDWKKPMSQAAFLASPRLQYKALCVSMKRYACGIDDGSIEQPEAGIPEDMTLSGALAVLHRCGPKGLHTWNNEDNRFGNTLELYRRANGVF